MQITDVQKVNSRRYKVFVDDEYWYIIDVEVMVDCGVKIGLECDEQKLADIKLTADTRRCKERALYLLGYRDHSKNELIKKLERDYDSDLARQTADKMQALGFLDDKKYAYKLFNDLYNKKSMAGNKIKLEMLQKGLDRALVDEIVDGQELDPKEQIEKLVKSKYMRYLNDEKGVQKVKNVLIRKGHRYSDIDEVIKGLLQEEYYSQTT